MTVLAGDITYPRTGQGRLHLSARMAVGWSMSGQMIPVERMTAFMERAERAFSEDEGRCRWPPGQ